MVGATHGAASDAGRRRERLCCQRLVKTCLLKASHATVPTRSHLTCRLKIYDKKTMFHIIYQHQRDATQLYNYIYLYIYIYSTRQLIRHVESRANNSCSRQRFKNNTALSVKILFSKHSRKTSVSIDDVIYYTRHAILEDSLRVPFDSCQKAPPRTLQVRAQTNLHTRSSEQKHYKNIKTYIGGRGSL